MCYNTTYASVNERNDLILQQAVVINSGPWSTDALP